MGYTEQSKVTLLGDRPERYFVMVPHALLFDAGLTSDAVRVGTYFLSQRNGYKIECGQRGIAKALSIPTVSRIGKAIRCLEAAGWLRYTKHRSGNRVYLNEYAMHRRRRFSVPSTDALIVPKQVRLLRIKNKRHLCPTPPQGIKTLGGGVGSNWREETPWCRVGRVGLAYQQPDQPSCLWSAL
ncbi:hypothetical protein MARA_11120 [Mycolicibacterium arabiense]|uniref:Helix-turn-helix domain-containing protein n=1 Tax=Mycolicibacterium arabiense TaxID=1286181 RepID=A0A7I7RSQ9_9MYCO|nr:hypothetical protein [Mycolicibacterium arabiense]MCV7375699.1 hypothetical protein [Mycolicibacterium arabiense]BBY47644.1 hypothetical protein MARA_11120 [Mycolicibacterium arabiense]